MIMQSGMTEMITKLSAPTDFKKPGEADKAQFPQFKDVLGQTVDKASKAEDTPKTPKSYKETAQEEVKSADPKDHIKTFREIARKESSQIVRKNAQGSEDPADLKETAKVDPSEDTSSIDEKQVETVVASLANILGLTQKDLQQLLTALQIKPEEVADASKTEEIASKLSEFMGLDSTQKSVLGQLLKLTAQKAEQLLGVNANQTEIPKQSLEADIRETIKQEYVGGTTESPREPEVEHSELKNSELKNSEFKNSELKNSELKNPELKNPEFKNIVFKNLEVIRLEKAVPDLSAIALQLKQKLQEMAQQIQINPGQFEESISQEVEGFMKQTLQTPEKSMDMNTSKAQDTEVTQIQAVKTGESETQAQTTGSGTGSQGEEDRGREPDSLNGKEPVVERTIPVVKDQGSQNNTPLNNAIVQPAVQNKAVVADEAVRNQKDLPVPKGEIIRQVVEKAKVVITGEKSEMVMDLKPDSLGKLTLKIATEQGIVVAKFVAENRQVKEIIESNMQLLKDSLEKQGMMVQGFSVSVGQDSYRGLQQNRFSQQGGSRENSTVKGDIAVAGSLGAEDKLNRMNAYSWSGSSINLTA